MCKSFCSQNNTFATAFYTLTSDNATLVVKKPENFGLKLYNVAECAININAHTVFLQKFNNGDRSNRTNALKDLFLAISFAIGGLRR